MPALTPGAQTAPFVSHIFKAKSSNIPCSVISGVLIIAGHFKSLLQASEKGSRSNYPDTKSPFSPSTSVWLGKLAGRVRHSSFGVTQFAPGVAE